jgi:hypothetical protein
LVKIHDVYRFSQKENRLTALLALTLEHHKPLLLKFFELINAQLDDSKVISFSLQNREDESIPDATIYVNKKKSFFIESKLGSSIESNQIFSHIKSGKQRIPLICITGGVLPPDGVEQALQKADKKEQELIKWVSWRQLYQTIQGMPEEILRSEMVSSLRESLEYENLVGFTGYRSSEIQSLQGVVSGYEIFLTKIDQLIDDVTISLSMKDKEIVPTRFVRDGRATSSLDTISFADFAFSFSDWEDCGYDATRDWVREPGSLVGISFYFDEMSIRVWGRVAYDTVKQIDNEENWKEVLDVFSSKGYVIDLLTNAARSFEEVEVDKAVDARENIIVIDFAKDYSFHDLLSKKPDRVVRTLTNDLLWILNTFKQKGLFTLRVN